MTFCVVCDFEAKPTDGQDGTGRDGTDGRPTDGRDGTFLFFLTFSYRFLTFSYICLIGSFCSLTFSYIFQYFGGYVDLVAVWDIAGHHKSRAVARDFGFSYRRF